MTTTSLTLFPNQDPNNDRVGIEAERNHRGEWIIEKAYKCGPNYDAPENAIRIPDECKARVLEFLDNAEKTDTQNTIRSIAEVADFKEGRHLTDGKGAYFAYLKSDDVKRSHLITTWMGHTLAFVTWLGQEYRCPGFGGFGSKRRNFRALGVDGKTYAGTAYVSAGQYVRMRLVKSKDA